MENQFWVGLFLDTGVNFFVGFVLVVFLNGFSGNFAHKCSINDLSTEIGGTNLDHARTGLILFIPHVGISVGYAP